MLEPTHEAIIALSQNSVATNTDNIKYLISVIVGLLGIINILGVIILNGIKKSISDLWNKVNKDHDLLLKTVAEHDVLHNSDH